MSDSSAINGVSQTLRKLLLDRMEFLPNSTAITISTPFGENTQSQTPGSPSPEAERLNLFLYQVTTNPFLSNQDLPSGRGSQGFPPLSLDLHYLVTAYGSTVQDASFSDESKAQRLLGSAMRVLHDYALINDRLVTARLAPLGQSILDASLRGQYETIKVYLDPVSIEDLTKIWTSLTSPYRLSAAYSVSVVQIESQRPRSYPQLVGEPPRAGPQVKVLPVQTPFIQSLAVHAVGDQPGVEHAVPMLHVGDTLILRGTSFGTETVLVALGGLEIPVRPVSGQWIDVLVPDDSYAFQGSVHQIPADQQIQPGALIVSVNVAPPGLPEATVRSNQVAAMLTPFVQAITPNPPVQARTLVLTGTRLYAQELSCESLIGNMLIPSAAYAASTPTQIELPLPMGLPFKDGRVFVGQRLPAFPNLNGALPSFDVTIGAVSYNGPNGVKLRSSPTTFVEAAAALEDALHHVTNQEPEFTRARVIPFSAATTNNGLVILPGILTDAVVVQNTAAAAQFGLAALTEGPAYLSGLLDPFPMLTTPPGALLVTFDVARAVSMITAPVSIEDAASQLQAAMRALPGPSFAQASVFPAEGQLLVVRGSPGPITIDVVPGVDATTAGELQFKTSYPVRVRVNGAEGVRGANRVVLPV